MTKDEAIAEALKDHKSYDVIGKVLAEYFIKILEDFSLDEIKEESLDKKGSTD